VNYMLAREFRRMGHTVNKYDMDDALSIQNKIIGRFKPAVFKLMALKYVREFGKKYDVIQAEHGALPFSKRTLSFDGVLVSSSVGLAHFYKQYSEKYGRESWDWSPKGILRDTLGWLAGRVNNPMWAVERSFETADLISLSGEDEYRYVAEELGYERKAFLRQNALSQNRLSRLEEKAQPPSSRLSNQKVAFIGYWNHRKGAEDWPGIVRYLSKQVDDPTFLLLGTGRSDGHVLSAFPRDYRSRIEVIPQYEYEELPHLLSDATVGILPSYTEGMPLGVLEMLAARLPVAAYDVPGPRDMLRHLPVSLMVPVGQTEQIATKISEVLQVDLTSYEQLSEAAHETANKFQWEEIAQKYLREVERIMENEEGKEGKDES